MANQYMGGGIGSEPKKKQPYSTGFPNTTSFPWEKKPTPTKVVNQPVGPVLGGEAYLNGEKVKVDTQGKPFTYPEEKKQSGSGGSAAVDKTAQAEALMRMYDDQYGQQESMLGDYRAQQELSAGAARDAMLKTAQSNYDKALAMRDQTYQKNTGDVNTQTESALTQAAINNAMQQRNIGQQMAALGRSGGAAESTLMGMNNNYGTVRGGLESTRGENLANLALDYSTGKAQDEQAFGNQTAQYESEYQMKMQNIQDYVTQQMLAARQALMQQKAAALAG